ncbi:MAG TPA: transglycosylase family protein [Acidimicrobiales bacterium]|nr:transglycosylase family protein [Acidimicrobiales bacterium]
MGTRRTAIRGLAILLLVGGLSACTPEQIQAYFDITGQHHDVLSGEQLEELRDCESGDDYTAIGGGGRYRGAYQFSRSTWDGVAERWYPWLEGIDPAEADPWWQDAQARALWAERGAQPWPHCGARVG